MIGIIYIFCLRRKLSYRFFYRKWLNIILILEWNIKFVYIKCFNIIFIND